jgi:hypothetical protein
MGERREERAGGGYSQDPSKLKRLQYTNKLPKNVSQNNARRKQKQIKPEMKKSGTAEKNHTHF